MNECLLCFNEFPNDGLNYTMKHHITYFPEHIMIVCWSCHAILTFSKDPIFDLLKQYPKGDRLKFKESKRERHYLKVRITYDSRHLKTIPYKGYY